MLETLKFIIDPADFRWEHIFYADFAIIIRKFENKNIVFISN